MEKEEGTCGYGAFPALTETGEAEWRKFLLTWWCGQQDSNLHGFPLEPKSSVSANSTIPAYEKNPLRNATGSGWSGQRGSNSLPPPWQGGALPDELCPHQQGIYYHKKRECQELFSYAIKSGRKRTKNTCTGASLVVFYTSMENHPERRIFA